MEIFHFAILFFQIKFMFSFKKDVFIFKKLSVKNIKFYEI